MKAIVITAAVTAGLALLGSVPASMAGIVTPAPTAAAGPFASGYAIVSPAGGDPTTPAQTNQQANAGVSLAQTIVTGNAAIPLDRIVILSGGKAGGTARLNIYPAPVGGSDTDGFVNTSFSTDLLNGGAGLDFAFSGSGSTQLLTLDLTGSDQITLAANTKYAIEIDVLTGTFSWQRSNQGEYPNGNLYSGASELNFNGTPPANGRGERDQVGGTPQRDGLFAIYGVPEPTTLTSLGAAIAVIARRRRSR